MTVSSRGSGWYFQVVDLSDPTNPTFVGGEGNSYGRRSDLGLPSDIDFFDHTDSDTGDTVTMMLFSFGQGTGATGCDPPVCDGGGVVIFSFSDNLSAPPTVISEINDDAGGFTNLGPGVAGSGGGLNLRIAAFRDSAGENYAIACGSGVQVIGLADPANPTPLGTVTCNRWFGDNCYDYDVEGFHPYYPFWETEAVLTFNDPITGHPFAIAFNDEKMQIISLENPSSPTAAWGIQYRQVGNYNDFWFGEYGAQAWHRWYSLDGFAKVAVAARRGYYDVTGHGGTVVIVDVADPYNPTVASQLEDGQDGFNRLRGARSIATFEEGFNQPIMLIASSDTTGGESSVQFIGLADPYNPTVVGSITDGEHGAAVSLPLPLCCRRPHACVVSVPLAGRLVPLPPADLCTA